MAVERDDSGSAHDSSDVKSAAASDLASQALPVGTSLRDYEIRGVIGESAFAIVYRAWDYSLRRWVALKEYLPHDLARRGPGNRALEIKAVHGAATAFAMGLKGFVAEARMLAHFDQPSLVKVYRFWEENGTAYMVMSQHEGPSLESVLTRLGRVQTEAEVRAWLRPMLDAISVMHAAHHYHHHIGPDNVVITPSGPVLLDFAAARRLIGSLAWGPASVVKAGYAPIEQYSEAATVTPGPWTDLYSLAAVAYRALTGASPPPAPERLVADHFAPLEQRMAADCSEGFVHALDAALSLQPEHRPRNHVEFRELMGDIEAPLPSLLSSAHRDLMSEPFAPDDGTSRQVTVPMPTQPDPLPSFLPSDPMTEPFIAAAADPQPMASAVFEPEPLVLNRKLIIALVAGICVLGALAGSVLLFYAQRAQVPEVTRPATAASQALHTAQPPAPITMAPNLAPVVAIKPAAPVASAPLATPAAPVVATQPSAAAATTAVPVATSAAESAPNDEAGHRVRCSDLLQEATLRRLTADEAEFFKKECR